MVVGINLIPGQEEGSMGLAIPIEDALELLALLKSASTAKANRKLYRLSPAPSLIDLLYCISTRR